MPEIIKQSMNYFQTGIPVTKDCGDSRAGMVECTYVLYTFNNAFVNDNETVETSGMPFDWPRRLEFRVLQFLKWWY